MATEKLIRAKALKEKLKSMPQWFDGPPQTDQDKLAQAVIKMCIEEVDKLKPVDAVEVVHGHWQYAGEPDEDCNVQAHCSVCGAGDKHATSMIGHVPYCWKCGAKMDGEKSETDGN